MIEKQIEIVIGAGEFEMDLPPDKSKAGAQLHQKPLDMIDERLFDFAFAPGIGRSQKIEQVWIFKDLRRHVGIRGRHHCIKIADGLAVTPVSLRINLQRKDAAAPPVFNRCLDVPLPCWRILHFVKKQTVMKPGNLCSSLLHKFPDRPGFGKFSHIFKIARRKALHIRKSVMQIGGKTVYDFCSPAFVLLSA